MSEYETFRIELLGGPRDGEQLSIEDYSPPEKLILAAFNPVFFPERCNEASVFALVGLRDGLLRYSLVPEAVSAKT